MFRQGIVHRDLKPENLLLVDDSQQSVVKVSGGRVCRMQERVVTRDCVLKNCVRWARQLLLSPLLCPAPLRCVPVPDVQIADFGLSSLIQPGQKLTKVCGTWAYAAPEMADHRRSGGYDCKFDCWSYGVILFVVLAGYHPFDPEGNLPGPEVRLGAGGARSTLWGVASATGGVTGAGHFCG